MKPKLVIIEGADGVGKSTQAKRIAAKIGAKIVSQPSDKNAVGFIRQIAKYHETLSSMERQLLIAVSHTVDSFTEFDQQESIVMDRSFLSGIIYGKLNGVPEDKMMILNQLLSTIYLNRTNLKYDTKVCFITRPRRLNQTAEDVFEKSIQWNKLNDEYKRLYLKAKQYKTPFFSEDEEIKLFEFENEDIDEVTKEIMSFVKS